VFFIFARKMSSGESIEIFEDIFLAKIKNTQAKK
jgi:hypothetical protein